MARSLEELGHRVMTARRGQGLTQLELAAAIDVDAAVISQIEAGERMVDALELARLAQALRRPIGWFVTEPPPSVVSRRVGRGDVVRDEDIQLEALAQDVEQLIGLGVLRSAAVAPVSIESIGAAEQAALDARRAAGLREDEPAWDLVRVVERLGLYAFVLPLDGRGSAEADGSYVALEACGVALVNGAQESGRRRFTIAHELGHHVLDDEYDPDWVVGADATEREKIVNAFAIHFLMPRAAVLPRWQALGGAAKPRDAAIGLGVELGVSWSAACAQLLRLGCLTAQQHEHLLLERPKPVDYIERELAIRDDVPAPLVPPGYAAAVIRALRQGRIGPPRSLELLHGTLLERDLPSKQPLSLDAMKRELEILLD